MLLRPQMDAKAYLCYNKNQLIEGQRKSAFSLIGIYFVRVPTVRDREQLIQKLSEMSLPT